MRILGIETSCDETAVAIYDAEQGLLAHGLYSQVDLHAAYGGVVPELASRDHNQRLIPLLRQVLAAAQTPQAAISAIAYTAGPGLAGALLVGATFGRTLAWAWQKPALAIHHMEGHLLAPFLEGSRLDFPFLALLVSGGHTLLIAAHRLGHYELLGESLDDAAGEAFDKTAKLLGLGYPGGAAISELAKLGDPKRFRFPRPLMDKPTLDFSFSGLKTYALNTWQNNPQDAQTKADIAYAFQDAVVATLTHKCKLALQQTGFKQLVIAGGVSANQSLRHQLQLATASMGTQLYFPRLEFCTDNGAMIAYAGYRHFLAGTKPADLGITIKPRWPLTDLQASAILG